MLVDEAASPALPCRDRRRRSSRAAPDSRLPGATSSRRRRFWFGRALSRSDSRRSASFQRDQNAATVEGPHVFTHDGADVPRQIALNVVSRSARINVPCATSASMRSFLVATDFCRARPNRRSAESRRFPSSSAATVPPRRRQWPRRLAPPQRQGGAAVRNELAPRSRSHFLAFLFRQPPFSSSSLFCVTASGKGGAAKGRRRGDGRRRNSPRRVAEAAAEPSSCQDRGWACPPATPARILLGVEFFLVGGRHQLGVFMLPGVEQPSHEGERH